MSLVNIHVQCVGTDRSSLRCNDCRLRNSLVRNDPHLLKGYDHTPESPTMDRPDCHRHQYISRPLTRQHQRGCRNSDTSSRYYSGDTHPADTSRHTSRCSPYHPDESSENATNPQNTSSCDPNRPDDPPARGPACHTDPDTQPARRDPNSEDRCSCHHNSTMSLDNLPSCSRCFGSYQDSQRLCEQTDCPTCPAGSGSQHPVHTRSSRP